MNKSNGPGTLPPGVSVRASRLARMLARPVEMFLHVEASSGILLLVTAVAALVWANSPWAPTYEHLLHTPISVGFGEHVFTRTIHFWINDILMVVFFFVVGLEVRRELFEGQLSTFRRAALPVAAAIGGMLVPAAIYLVLNAGSSAVHGWGVPMATDIAFAVGVLALLGRRVPPALRVLLLALAIIDDIGAILVIALFYSSGIVWIGLGIVGIGIAIILVMQRIGVRNPFLYIAPGIVIWAGMMHAGIHPTIAGVILGLLTPVRSWFGHEGFVKETERVLDSLRNEATPVNDPGKLLPGLERINTARREAVPPVTRIEAALHPWVAFAIMPLFALANAGVAIGGQGGGSSEATGIALGVGLGLVVGKPLGIVVFSWLAVRVGLASLPRGVSWAGVLVVGCVAGIGFTMALFIGALAFADASMLAVAKLTVLAASTVSGVVGLVVGYMSLSTPPAEIPSAPAERMGDHGI
ncbi:MAG: Na+/H+ antiporter NhaA [Deltaproteobacteria bacterium]|nr:Na+/H+ antiporter NhaA [Deltaproteobacteria bacterium]